MPVPLEKIIMTRKNMNKVYATKAVKEKTHYRYVIDRIVKFAEKEVKQLYPDLNYKERVAKAHDEPFWTASKELRDLTESEKRELGLVL